jgi:hypothetical protein
MKEQEINSLSKETLKIERMKRTAALKIYY